MYNEGFVENQCERGIMKTILVLSAISKSVAKISKDLLDIYF